MLAPVAATVLHGDSVFGFWALSSQAARLCSAVGLLAVNVEALTRSP